MRGSECGVGWCGDMEVWCEGVNVVLVGVVTWRCRERE